MVDRGFSHFGHRRVPDSQLDWRGTLHQNRHSWPVIVGNNNLLIR
jgi:hypothetical protein